MMGVVTLVVLSLLALVCSSSPLYDMLRTTDSFFHDDIARSEKDVQTFQEMMERSYGFSDGSTRKKRSVPELQNKGVPVLQRILNITYSNIYLPYDLNAIESNGETLVFSVQRQMSGDADGRTDPPLLALFKIKEKTAQLLDSVPLETSGNVEVHKARDAVLAVVTQKGLEDISKGCSVYVVAEESLRRVQVLEIANLSDIVLTAYFGKDYLAISSLKSILIYEWQGRYFDLMQELNAENIHSLDFYTIENSLYLASVGGDAKQPGAYGESESCGIWEQNPESRLFECRQFLQGADAMDVHYFHANDYDLGRENHYLAVGYKKEPAVIYKYDGYVFQPFQYFPDHRNIKWLPYQGVQGELVLFLVTEEKLSAYTYDGWRFNKMELTVDHDSLAGGRITLRTVHEGDKSWLIAVNPDKEIGAMMELSFVVKPDVSDSEPHLDQWCQSQRKDRNGAVERLQRRLESVPSGDTTVYGNITFQHLEVEQLNVQAFGSFDGKFVDKINELALMLNELNELMSDVETLSMAYTSDAITVKGPVTLESLVLDCGVGTRCGIPNLSAGLINGHPVKEFILNTVSLKNGITTQGYLEFDSLLAENVTSTHINDHPAHALVSREENLSLVKPLRVEGNVIFHGDVFVRGQIQGVLLDREHAVLTDGNQSLSGSLIMKSGTVKNLTLKGSLNGADVRDLAGAGHSVHTLNSWDQLNVLNLTLHGRLAGRPVWKLLGEDNPAGAVAVDSVSVASGSVSGVDLSDLVRISNGSFRLHSDVTCLRPVHVTDLQVEQTVNDIPLATLIKLTAASEGMEDKPVEQVTLRHVVGDRVVVRGHAKVADIVSSEGYSFSDMMGKRNISSSDTTRSVLNFSHNPRSNENETVSEEVTENDEDDFDCVDWEDRSKVSYVKRTDTSGQLIYEVEGPVTINSLVANSLNITETVDGVNWTELVTDAVFKGESTPVMGQTILEGDVSVNHLVIEGLINNQTVDEFVRETRNRDNTENIFLSGDISLNHSLEVEEIVINGTSLFKPFNSSKEGNNPVFHLKNVIFIEDVNVRNINNISIGEFLETAVHTDRAANFDTVNFIQVVEVTNVTSTGLVNGVDFAGTVIAKNSSKPQVVDGHWLFKQGVQIDGELVVDGKTSGMKMGALCAMAEGPTRVIVGGSVETSLEPKISMSVNGIPQNQLQDDLWYKNEKTELSGRVRLPNTQVLGNLGLDGKLNGVDLNTLPKGYLSKTIPRRMQAPLFVSNLTVRGPVRASKITGQVNGMKVGEFAASVLLHGVEQTFKGRPHFHEIHIPDLRENCTVNGMNMARDVLRYDVEGAVVSGAKTVEEVVAETLILPSGLELQGVDFGMWVQDAVMKDATTIDGNTSFNAFEVLGTLKVRGTVGSMFLDSAHVLTTKGNQTVSAQKTFTGPIQTEALIGEGLINGVDLRSIIESAVYSEEDVVITSPLELENLEGAIVNVEGYVAGVNVTRFCNLAQNLTQINDLNESHSKLLNASQQVYGNLANGAYYLDHYRMIQKFRVNVTNVAAVPIGQVPVIAVFRKKSSDSNNVTLMAWDDREKLFKRKEGIAGYALDGNVTLVSSGRSFLLTERWRQGGSLFYNNQIYSINVTSATYGVPFTTPDNDTCVFLGSKDEADVVMCGPKNSSTLLPRQSFNTTGCIQMATVKTHDKIWLAVIGRKMYRPASEVYVTVLSMRDGHNLFFPRQDLAVLHPVSVAATAHGRYCYLVVASQHQPESVRSSLLSIFRYTSHGDKWTRYQEVTVEAPVYVSFEELPTGQLALYVLTANPARAFLVFLYRGAEGFIEETAGFATHPGKILSAFDGGDRHFVGIAGNGYGQLLQAELRGRRHG